MARPSLHDLTFRALEDELASAGLPRVHALPLWRALYREWETIGPALAKNAAFPPPLRRWLGEHPPVLDVPMEHDMRASADGQTQKFLLRLGDGQTIETVLMGYDGRHTACVSTQAGCAMGCVFCATGQMGFVRHLRAGEIVAQVLHAQRALGGGLRNLVLMGMGEPLHNYDAVMAALEIIADSRGLGLAPGRITISTVGVVPGILRLVEEKQPWNLAVSLHGSTEEERAALVPVSARWSLRTLISACHEYSRQTERKIFFEWTLIAGRNDSPAHAERLGALLRGIRSHVNLIPLNPTAGYDGTESGAGAAAEFQRTLRRAGVPSTVRQRRGIDVAAGCGQLTAQRPSCVPFFPPSQPLPHPDPHLPRKA